MKSERPVHHRDTADTGSMERTCQGCEALSPHQKRKLLFVCTGNICRSPMAKVILEQLLAERGITDVIVDSAGVSACTGYPATENAVTVIRERYGTDLLKDHIAKSTDSTDLADFDLILTMEDGHKRLIPSSNVFTLAETAGRKGDVYDPIGGDEDTYRAARDQIEDLIRRGFESILEMVVEERKGGLRCRKRSA